MAIVKSIAKGVMLAVITTLLFVLGFALIIKWGHLGNGVIKPVMQVIKVIGILVGVMVARRHINSKYWLFGGLVGILYMLFTFLIFSLIDGHFIFGWNFVSDLLFQTLVGICAGILLRPRNKDVEIV